MSLDALSSYGPTTVYWMPWNRMRVPSGDQPADKLDQPDGLTCWTLPPSASATSTTTWLPVWSEGDVGGVSWLKTIWVRSGDQLGNDLGHGDPQLAHTSKSPSSVTRPVERSSVARTLTSVACAGLPVTGSGVADGGTGSLFMRMKRMCWPSLENTPWLSDRQGLTQPVSTSWGALPLASVRYSRVVASPRFVQTPHCICEKRRRVPSGDQAGSPWHPPRP